MAANTQPQLERQADVDIGYDYSFEHKWAHFERVVWVLFTALLVLSLLGFLGRGPLNRVSQRSEDGTLVRYERVVRFKSPSVVTFDIPVRNGVAELEPSQAALKQLGLERVLPPPTKNLGSEQVGPLLFQPSPPDATHVFVELAVQPSGLGPVTSTYLINGRDTIIIGQFIVP